MTPKSDGHSPAGAARSEGHFGGFRAADILSAAIALAVGAAVLCATLWSATVLLGPQLTRLAVASDDGAELIARAVSEDLSAAIALGIPLEKMVGVDDYLKSIVDNERLVSKITISDNAEKQLFSMEREASAGDTDGGRQIRTPISVGEETRGYVIVTPGTIFVEAARARVFDAAVAIALVAGLVAGIIVRIALLERHNLAQSRFSAAAGAVSRGVLADFSTPPTGPMRDLGRAAANLIGPVRRERRQLVMLADEVSALDTEGRLGGRISGALKPLGALRFERPLRFRATVSLGLWWPTAALTVLLAARPLVASFSADRIGSGAFVPIAVGGAVAAHMVGALLGLVAAGLLRGRLSKTVSCGGLLVAGSAIAVTALLRDPTNFAIAQAVAGFFGFLAVGSALCADDTVRRLPFRPALLIVAALAVGPAIGVLLSEAEGRRLAFATIGALCGAAALLAVPGPTRKSRQRRPLHLPAKSTLFAMAAVGFALCWVLEIHLSVRIHREDYAGFALSCTAFGAAAFAPFLLVSVLQSLRRTVVPMGLVLTVLALLASSLQLPHVPAAIALGLGAGFTLVGLGRDSATGLAAAALLVGCLLAALIEMSAALSPDAVELVAGSVLIAMAGAAIVLRTIIETRR